MRHGEERSEVKIKRFLADDLPSAVAAVRRELGREAVILTTGPLAAPGWRRLFRRFDRVEVSAAVEESAFTAHLSRSLQAVWPRAGGAAESTPGAPPVVGVPVLASPRTVSGAGGGPPPGAMESWRPPQVPEGTPPHLPAAPATAATGAPGPPPGGALDVRESEGPDPVRVALVASGVAPTGTRAPQAISVRPGMRRLVALVGPTGAGKTTTLAKIAAHLHLQQGWRVGLITADTFRVGAVEQLAAYARLLGLPLEVTPTPAALERALLRMRTADVVLIDTSGRGHRDLRRMDDLMAFLRVARQVAGGGAAEPRQGRADPGPPAAPPLGPGGAEGEAAQSAGGVEGQHLPGGLEVHLVLAAPTRRQEVAAMVEAYRPVADRCLLTKLDECEAPPEALAVLGEVGLALSYCCAGQRVPEDLALAWPDRLVAGLVARLAPEVATTERAARTPGGRPPAATASVEA